MDTTPETTQLLSLDDAARRLGLHRRSVERLIARGVLPVVAIGRRRLVAESDLGRLIAASRHIA